MNFDLSNRTDQELEELFGSNKPGTDFWAACKMELERRKRKNDFWRKDIVAWIALVLALISLIWQFVK